MGKIVCETHVVSRIPVSSKVNVRNIRPNMFEDSHEGEGGEGESGGR